MNISTSKAFNKNHVVFVPAFNAGKFLKLSLESLINQQPERPRVILIDDASTDGSIKDIQEYLDSGLVEIKKNRTNLGKAKSLNQCFAETHGTLFFLQDADDIAMPNRIYKQAQYMANNPDVACSCSFIKYINTEDKEIAQGRLDLLDSDKLEEYLAGNEPFGMFCPSIVLRSDVAKYSNTRFRSEFWPADDIDLWNRMAEAGHTLRVQPEYLVKYRVHGNSIISKDYYKSRMQYEWVRCCLKARRTGMQEPTQEEFLKSWRGASINQKFKRMRKITAKGMYRSAGFAHASSKPIRAAVCLLLATILSPIYTIKRLTQQIIHE